MDVSGCRRDARELCCRDGAHTIVNICECVPPASLGLCPERERISRQGQRIGKGRLVMHFKKVIMCAGYRRPFDVEKFAHVKTCGACWRNEHGCGWRDAGAGNSKTAHCRPQRIDSSVRAELSS